MYGIDAAILMNPKAWVASGHVGGFSDPLSECQECKHRFRTDHLEDTTKCPDCGGELGESKQFNMMFQTQVGAVQNDDSVTYLRPETAGGMFVNFKNVVDTMHPKLPFGMGQIGKAFRNEIAPRDFIFRVRELEQMEIEYFVRPETWEANFEHWRNEMHRFIETIGLDTSKVHELEVTGEDLAHYSKRTIDFEFEYPFGRKELYGLAYRTDFDLSAHQEGSKQKLEYFDEEKGEKLLPHVIEPSFGVGRTILAVLCSAYKEDTSNPEDIRPYLALEPRVAPIKVAVFPLLKNKEVLTEKAKELHKALKQEFGAAVYYETGSIGKRYRKQDEIGTPFCITVDFESIEGDTAGTYTIRDRDTGEQERVNEEELFYKIKNALA
jgi:glycyl-tRNA synthetase